MPENEISVTDDLGAAIADVGRELRSRPGDVRLRTALFELLCFAGEFARAEKQLDVILQQSAGAEAGVHVHRTILQAERVRAAVFAGEGRPEFLGTVPGYADLQLRALAEVRANRAAAARTLLEEAVEARPAISGTIDGREFEELQDADDFLGTVLEVIMRDGYRWLVMSEVRALSIAPPRTQRDLLWAQASLDLVSGESLEIFLPVLYAGSSVQEDDRIRLGRMTDWVEVGSGLVRGVGQRLFLVDGEERPLLEVREIEVSRAPSRTPSPGETKLK